MSNWGYGTKQEELLTRKLSEKIIFRDLSPVVGSGNQFYAKEDLTNEVVLCQVKSTKSLSYNIGIKDVKKLVYNSFAVFKFPIFIINFSKANTLKFLVLRSFTDNYPEHLRSGFTAKWNIVAQSRTIKTKEVHGSHIFDDIEMVLLNFEDFE